MTPQEAVAAPADVIQCLTEWFEAVQPWTLPQDDFSKEEVEALITTTQNFREALGSYGYALDTEGGGRDLSAGFSDSFTLTRNLIDISARFLWQCYTDSDMDAPVDMEWDTHVFLTKYAEGYQMPDDEDLRPAYVSNFYDGPEED